MTSSQDDLETLRHELRTFVDERGWSTFHTPKNLTMAITSEAGELAQELRWVEGTESDAHCAGPMRASVLAEIADVLLCTLMLCERIGADPVAIARAKLAKNAAKYPADPSGRTAPDPART